MRAPPNDKNPKQSWLFLIGWIFGLANHKALVFEVRVVGYVYVKGTQSLKWLGDFYAQVTKGEKNPMLQSPANT